MIISTILERTKCHMIISTILERTKLSHDHNDFTNALKIMWCFFSQTTEIIVFCVADKRNI